MCSCESIFIQQAFENHLQRLVGNTPTEVVSLDTPITVLKGSETESLSTESDSGKAHQCLLPSNDSFTLYLFIYYKMYCKNVPLLQI